MSHEARLCLFYVCLCQIVITFSAKDWQKETNADRNSGLNLNFGLGTGFALLGCHPMTRTKENQKKRVH